MLVGIDASRHCGGNAGSQGRGGYAFLMKLNRIQGNGINR